MNMPEGWPTGAMIKAGKQWLTHWQHMNSATRDSNLEEAFKAMLAAAPTPPVPRFSDSDLPLPEDAEILAAHPLNSKDFHSYGEAQRMVSAKHSKFALVALVNWLLSRIPPAPEVEPVGVVKWWNTGGSGEFQEVQWTRVVPQDGTKLYTRPADDKLGKLVDTLLNEWDNDDPRRTCFLDDAVEALRDVRKTK